MIPTEHKNLILRLLKPGRELIDEMTPDKANIMHGIVGLAGEAAGEIELAVLPMRQLEAYADGNAPNEGWWGDVHTAGHSNDVQPGFDRENMLEELGDLLFYEGAIRIFTNMESYTCGSPSEHLWAHAVAPWKVGLPRKKIICDLVSALNVAIGQMTDAAKRHVMYAQDLNYNKMAQSLTDFNWAVSNIAIVLGYSEKEVRQHNIDKLNKRYPEGYSDQAAKERVDKAEEVIHG